MDLRLINFTLGALITLLGLLMLFPAALDFYEGHANATAFFKPSLISLFIGGVLLATNKDFDKAVNVKQAFFLTTMSWVFLSLFSSLPFIFSDLHLSFSDALFEATSGITTTGSTVLSNLEGMSKGILLWRSLLQWIGGIGIICFGIILLPFLRIGGMQLFRSESSDTSEKVLTKSSDIMINLLIVYICLTAACLLVYEFVGMTFFDALNHAMTTIATGGFSTHDASFGYYESKALHVSASFFMIMGAIPFYLYLKAVHQQKFEFFKDVQVRAFLAILFGLTLFLSFYIYLTGTYENFSDAFVRALFNITAVLTTTGYASTDYLLWGGVVSSFFLFITYIGACSGSTSGGLKMMRVLIAFSTLRTQFYKLIFPHSTKTPMYQNHSLKNEDVQNVLGFMFLYVVINIFLTLALLATGLDFETALSSAATAIANVGPGIGKTVGPAGNFAPLSDAAKYILSFAMIVGRLEILTVLVILTPHYWKK